MRSALVVLLAGVCALALGVPSGQQQQQQQADVSNEQQQIYRTGDKQFLQRQRDILRLFKYINQPYYYYKDQYEIAKSYSIEENLNNYTNQTAVKQFVNLYRQGFLPRGEVFSVFNEYQLQQAIALFNVFYYAKDYDTFYRTAVYLRNQVNEGIYLYSLSVAILYRPDTAAIVLPPIYEVYPYYFFNSEVIQKAYQYKQQYYGQQQQAQSQGSGSYNGYTVYANYSGWYLNLNPEQSLSYYTEDIGINAFYYYYNLYYPFWINSQQYNLRNNRRGEQYYFLYQQLLARYYLERLSNDFGEVDYLDYEQPIEYGYYPSLRYANGLEFPSRPSYTRLSDYFYNYGERYSINSRYGNAYTLVQDYERRIRDAIDSGFVITRTGEKIDIYSQQGIEILGDLIESNGDSVNPRYYGPYQTYARQLLGYSYQPLKRSYSAPSALEQFETSLRDPVFYSLYKKVVLLFQQYKSYLAPYSYNELAYQGVKIENVQFDRLITYFDYFDSDISNAVYVSQQEYEKEYEGNYFQIRARQSRLNNKPFNYRINVTAEQAGEAIVKVYLGPKYDEYGRQYDINENRINFVQFDEFRYTLQAGRNAIERSSRQNSLYGPDRTSFAELYRRVSAALNGDREFQVDRSELYYSYPLRYLLPKGKYGGQTYQIYVIVAPYQAPKNQYPSSQEARNFAPFEIDAYPFGYPLDRRIDETVFYVPNSYFQDVTVYYRNYEDVNTATSQNVGSENEA